MSDTPFRLEILKLLLQVAWANHDISTEEAETIRQFAKQYRLNEYEMTRLEAYLDGSEPLSMPNINVLKERKQEVLIATQMLILSDLAVLGSEKELLKKIDAML